MYKYHELGKKGEELTCFYLESLGYRILKRNFRYTNGEIDIIAEDNGELVFIEVKTRSNNRYGEPSESITKIKKKHLYRTAQLYLKINCMEGRYTRFDVVEIYFHHKRYYIHHIKQIM